MAIATGDQVVDSGTGVVGKFLMLWATRQTAEGVDNTSASAMFVGAAADSTHRGCVAIAGDDNVATTNFGKGYFTDRILEMFSDGTPTVDAVADFVSFGTGANAGKFTINFSDAPASAWICHYIFMGGDGGDLTNVYVGGFTGPTAGSTGNKGFTGVGFQGEFGIFLNAHATATGTGAGQSFGFGVAKDSTNRWSFAGAANDAVTMTTFCERAASITKCLMTYAHGSLASHLARDNVADFVSWDTDGFTLNYSTVTTGSVLFLGVVIKGIATDVDATIHPTAAGNQDVTTAFDAKGVLTLTPRGIASGGLDTEASTTSFAIGAGTDDPALAEDVAAYVTANSINTAQAMWTRTTKSVDEPGGTTEDAVADFVSTSATFFRVNWSGIDATGHYWFSVAFGGVPGAFSLSLDPGSYSLSGVAATPLADRSLAGGALPGSYAVSGAAGTVVAGRSPDGGAGAGSYALTGVDLTPVHGFSVSADPGAYVLAGSAATALAARLLPLDPGSYSVSGVAATVLADRLLVAATGAYALSGFAATLVYTPSVGAFELLADPGTYTVAAPAASVLAARLLSADPAAYALAGAAADLRHGYLLALGAGSYALVGPAATIILGHGLEADPGVYLVVGTDLGIEAPARFVNRPWYPLWDPWKHPERRRRW